MNNGLTFAVSPITFSKRRDADSDAPRACSMPSSGLLNAPLNGQFFRIVPLETSSQSLHVPVCQNSSDNMPVIVASVPMATCMPPSAPAATAGRRPGAFAASLVNACGFCTESRSLQPMAARSTAPAHAHRTA